MASRAVANQHLPLIGLTHLAVTSRPVAQHWRGTVFTELTPEERKDPANARLVHVEFAVTAPELNRQLELAGRWTPELWSAELSVRRVLWEVGLEAQWMIEDDAKAHGCTKADGMATQCEVMAIYDQQGHDGALDGAHLLITVPTSKQKTWINLIGHELTRATWAPDLAA